MRLMASALVFGILLSVQVQAASATKDEAKAKDDKPAAGAEEFKGTLKEFDEKTGTMTVIVGKDERILKITDDSKFVLPMGMGAEKFDLKKHGKMLKGGVGKKEAKYVFKAKKGDKEWTVVEIGLDIQMPPGGPGGPGARPFPINPGKVKGVQVQPVPVQPVAPPAIDR